ncbi:MAG: hypothetical protein HYZ28_27745 [Myxococcales bacterium]|nr:hypothetical protein [Myxococcales bacterium]
MPVEAVIEDSDEEGIYVRTGSQRFFIPGEQVDDIDHPGNVLMVIGGAALGAATLGVIIAASDPSERQAGTFMAGTYGAIGLGFLIGGGIPWALSRGAAMRYEHRPWKEVPVLSNQPADAPVEQPGPSSGL